MNINYDPDPVMAWALDSRKLTFIERCIVGWGLWRNKVSRFPWPVAQTNPKGWIYP